jgi:hypothetical protein
MKNLVRSYLQRDGEVTGRWAVNGSSLPFSRREGVHWLNEDLPPTEGNRRAGGPPLHNDARGF